MGIGSSKRKQWEIEHEKWKIRNEEIKQKTSEMINERSLIAERDLSDSNLEYRQVLETCILRVGGLGYDFPNKRSYDDEKSYLLSGLDRATKYHPLIGDLILRYFRDNNFYLFDFLKDYKLIYLPTMDDKNNRYIPRDNYENIFMQIYCSICNIEEIGTFYVKFNSNEYGTLKTHQVSTYWSFEKSVELLIFLIKNQIFVEYLFSDDKKSNNELIYNQEPTNIYKLISNLIKDDDNCLDILYSKFQRNNIVFTLDQLIRFLFNECNVLDEKLNSNLKIFKRFNIYSNFTILFKLAKCDKISFESLSKLFDQFYDKIKWKVEDLDKLFILSCENRNSNFSRMMSLKQFENRKYKVYFKLYNIIDTYRIGIK
jgi:hypothetical protein